MSKVRRISSDVAEVATVVVSPKTDVPPSRRRSSRSARTIQSPTKTMPIGPLSIAESQSHVATHPAAALGGSLSTAAEDRSGNATQRGDVLGTAENHEPVDTHTNHALGGRRIKAGTSRRRPANVALSPRSSVPTDPSYAAESQTKTAAQRGRALCGSSQVAVEDHTKGVIHSRPVLGGSSVVAAEVRANDAAHAGVVLGDSSSLSVIVESHGRIASHTADALDGDFVVQRLKFLGRCYFQLQSARVRLMNQISAMKRLESGVVMGKDGKPTKTKREPTLDDMAVAMATIGHLKPSLDELAAPYASYEKEIARLAEQLPIAPFVENVRGLGFKSVGLIVAAAGSLSQYSNPAKLWKRMGLALVDGERQRRVADAEAALKHGYNPKRRALMHVVGECLIKGNGADGEYKMLYASRRAHTAVTHPEWKPLHSHRDGMRYMEKRILRDLWQEWRKADSTNERQSSTMGMSQSAGSESEATQVLSPHEEVSLVPSIV